MASSIASTGLRVSDRAATRILQLAARKQAPKLMLRIEVEGGGCAGFQYRYSWTERLEQDDQLIEHQSGAKVVIDPTSLDFLQGSEIDYLQELIGARFQVNNPNARAACGCGASFSIG